MVKQAHLRTRAAEDIERATADYVDEAGVEVATTFVDSVERAFGRITRQPHLGSLRFAYDLGVPDLRSWPVHRFPYLIFYVEHDDRLDVWRVLHTRRDLPATLADASDE